MQSLAQDMLSAVKVQWDLSLTRVNEWVQNDVFRFRWWFLLIFFMVSAFIWWKKVDKSRCNEIILYTLLIGIISLVLDELGEELCLWDYPVDIIPLFPPISAIDLASLPMIYSLIYQYFTPWKKFIIATVVMALVFCFVFEPLVALIGVYQPITWRYYYGFPIYIAIGIGTKAAVIKLYSIKEKRLKA